MSMRLSSSGVSTVISRSPTVNRSPIGQVTDITAGGPYCMTAVSLSQDCTARCSRAADFIVMVNFLTIAKGV